MVGNMKTLPAGYEKIRDIDLKKNRREALIVNVTAAIIAVVMAVIGHFIVPVQTLFDMTSVPAYFARFGVLLVGLVAYIILHEAVHGVVMYHYCKVKPTFGFTGMYAYAGSNEDFFDKASYRLIALAPLVVWGVIFTVLLLALPKEWFWVLWLLQIGNISGAAGDVYVTATLWKRPETILVKDTGIDMTVYDRA